MKIENVSSEPMFSLLPFPADDANKYTRGKLTLIGGSNEYPGAACLASRAALRCGCGYLEVACDEVALQALHAQDPNVVARNWRDFSCASYKLDVVKEGHPCAILIGSGFDRGDDLLDSLLDDVLENSEQPVLVDGGALEILSTPKRAQMATKRRDLGRTLVLTPHFGEAARLASAVKIPLPDFYGSSDEVLASFAKELSVAYKATVALKGPRTYIVGAPEVDDSGTCHLISDAPAALAKAGTGDVLAGMAASFLSQGLKELDAVKLACLLHAMAAISVTKSLTSICMCATDVADHIPDAVIDLCQSSSSGQVRPH